MGERFATKLFCVIFLVAGVAVAQTASPRKDIPTIAKAANGAIVSIVMLDKDGNPIAEGSGFFISKDGDILTNYHVIENGSSAIVKRPDGAFFLVDGVLASDKARDVAVIKAHGENFQILTLGNSDALQVGQEVVAIGNPLSLASTVSNGLVSGIRTFEEKGGKVLQITAPISHGSSGGPLFNMAGEVIGITTAGVEGGENLNFAIPINDAKRLLLARSAKIQALPNKTEWVVTSEEDVRSPVKTPAQPGATIKLVPPAAQAPTSGSQSKQTIDLSAGLPRGFVYYQQLRDAGAFSERSPDYVCFSDDRDSDTFFTFTAWAYAEDLLKSWSNAPYVTFLNADLLKEFFPQDQQFQQFLRSGGRALEESIYEKGVKVTSIEYHWNGSSWFISSPPADPNAYTKTSKIFQLFIEPSSMRYVESTTSTITVGYGETAATRTDRDGPWGGVCENVQRSKVK
jgi:S1-C subfamily serine protease